MEADMVRRTVTVAGVLAAALLVGSQAAAQTADDVIDKHFAATGGRAAWAKLTSQISTGTLVTSTPNGDFTGTMEIARKAPNKTRVLIKLDLSSVGMGELIVDQRCDGKTAYASNSLQGDREITGSQLESMLNNTFPSPLLDYKAAGATVSFVGKEKVGDRDAYVLQYTPKSGPGNRQYFDAETYYVIKVVSKVDTAEMGTIEQTNEAGDYRDVGGVKVPFALGIVNPAQKMTITLSKVDLNPQIDDAVFARPGAK
jgi:outer membrane lipoprotein-sorting protein